MKKLPLNTSDDELDFEEEFEEIEDITQLNREEGHIYESIEHELDYDDELELTELVDIRDLLPSGGYGDE